MQFAVIGLGRFGSHLAERLVTNGCRVLVLDSDEVRVNELKAVVDKAVIADATDRKALEALDLGDYDGVILNLGENMESSVLAALHLRDIGIANVVAKVVTEDHGRVLNLIGVSQVVYPERDMAQRLADNLSHTNVVDRLTLAPGYGIFEIAVPAQFVGRTLADLQVRNRWRLEVIAVRERPSSEIHPVPGADFVIAKDHVLIVLGRETDLDALRTEVG